MTPEQEADLPRNILLELERGTSIEVITEKLLEAGWRLPQVERALEVSGQIKAPEEDSKTRRHRYVASALVGLCCSVVPITGLYFLYEPPQTGTITYNLITPQLPDKKYEALSYGVDARLARPELYQQTIKMLQIQGLRFITADLTQMKLVIYEGKEPLLEVPILTKGKDGSWWETPAGIYKIEGKSEFHSSSFAPVDTPYNMQFQGNFLIHGWPKYKNGTPVTSQFSGGCIRLSDEDAQKVYVLVPVGTPVIVHEKDFEPDTVSHGIREAATTDIAHLVADVKSNYVFFEKGDAETPYPIASITKLITALTAVEYINLDTEVRITEDMIVSTSKPRLVVGEKYRIYELLFPLLLESSNEAAEAIARAGSKIPDRKSFIALMNKKARAIGMTHAQFVDPSGAGSENVASPQDLHRLAQYLYFNRKFVLDVSSGKLKENAYGSHSFDAIQNFNDFADAPEFVGGKVGETTAAKQTALFVFEIPFGKSTRPVSVIVFGADDRKGVSSLLISRVKDVFY